MNLRKLLKTHFRGWLFILKSLLWILVWAIIVFLPAHAFGLVFPDEMEGKADGTLRIQIISLICVLIWAPLAAAKIGPLEPIGGTESRAERQTRQTGSEEKCDAP